MSPYRFGWLPDAADARDREYVPDPRTLAALPAAVDLRDSAHQPPIYDQGDLASCTANAIAALYEFIGSKDGFNKVMPSRLFIYYNERAMENSIRSDSGAQLRDGIKSVAKLGVCRETEFPYEVHKFKEKPPAFCYERARNSRAIEYLRVKQKLADLKSALAAGSPFVFGFTVYTSFMSDETAATGVGTLPQAHDKIDGGHAVMCVGYDDAARVFIMRNSWGRAWGRRGFFTLPYDYLTSPELSNDFWTIRHVSASALLPGRSAEQP